MSKEQLGTIAPIIDFAQRSSDGAIGHVFGVRP